MRFLIYSIVLSLLLGGGALVASRAFSGKAEAGSAQEPSSSDPATQPGSAQTEQEKQQEKDYEDEMEDFVPSEKLPADSAISFPVDI